MIASLIRIAPSEFSEHSIRRYSGPTKEVPQLTAPQQGKLHLRFDLQTNLSMSGRPAILFEVRSNQ